MRDPAPQLDPWLARNLVCPKDFSPLTPTGDRLVSAGGRAYPVVEGVPIMLVEDARPTIAHCVKSIEKVVRGEMVRPADASPAARGIDAFVQQNVAASCGLMYRSAINRLRHYPIPEIPLPPSSGERLLDIGCNWGRWSLSAARKGYLPVGIDPAVDGVLAAQRVARTLGLPALYVVGDARHLPFAPATFDIVHAYSVFLHLAKADVRESLADIARVLKWGGRAVIQMPGKFGPRNLHIQAMRGFREPADPSSFETRYWRVGELRRTFEGALGPTHVRVDGFFFTSAGSDALPGLPAHYRALLSVSRLLARASRAMPPLRYVADSLYVESVRTDGAISTADESIRSSV